MTPVIFAGVVAVLVVSWLVHRYRERKRRSRLLIPTTARADRMIKRMDRRIRKDGGL